MKIIVLTLPEKIDNEATKLVEILNNGVDKIHIRKKNSLISKEEVLFDCNDLAKDYEFFNLSNIKIKPIFKWLKKNKIKDSEMIKTFNCGVGFCLVTKRKNLNKIKKIFTKKYKPYEIGYISKDKKKSKYIWKN